MDKYKQKPGRPTDSPKCYMLRARIDRPTEQKLNECSSLMGVSKSQAVRLAISYLEKNIHDDKTW